MSAVATRATQGRRERPLCGAAMPPGRARAKIERCARPLLARASAASPMPWRSRHRRGGARGAARGNPGRRCAARPRRSCANSTLVPRGPAYETWLFDDPRCRCSPAASACGCACSRRGGELTLKIADAGLPARWPRTCCRRAKASASTTSMPRRSRAPCRSTRTLDAATAARWWRARARLPQALGRAQVHYLREVAPRVDPLPAGLRPLGPIANRVWRTRDDRYDVDDQHAARRRALPWRSRIKVPLERVGRAAQTALTPISRGAVSTVCADQAGQAGEQDAPAAGQVPGAGIACGRLPGRGWVNPSAPPPPRPRRSRAGRRPGSATRGSARPALVPLDFLLISWRSAIVMRERSRTYSAHELMM